MDELSVLCRCDITESPRSVSIVNLLLSLIKGNNNNNKREKIKFAFIESRTQDLPLTKRVL